VVLDEMQEVRSSTTELARKCERLHAPRRWMVSGTPLYDKIDDLQGELYFLRVSPFGAGHEDGFWRHVIGTPWEARQETALDALHVLLRGVMMRHAKSQTHIDGRSILSLPPKTLEYVAVQLAESELTSYAFLEALFVKEIRRCRALQSILMRGGVAVAAPPPVGLANNPFHRAGALSGAQLLVTALRLLREACVALPLLGAQWWLVSRGEAYFGTSAFNTSMLIGCGVMTAASLMLFAASIRRIRYSTAGLLQYISPSLVFLTAVFIFGEPMDAVKLVSFLIIWVALAIFSVAAIRDERNRRQEMEPV
jgi:multidrug transporter EmrE-like cation transporter